MSQTISSLKSLFELDLERLKDEVTSYENVNNLWKVMEGVSNSGGHLALHICGNLQHFFGAVIAEDGYVRDRNFEFNSDDLPLERVLLEIESAKKAVNSALDLLDEDSLSGNYPLEIFGFPMTYNYFLIRLVGHLNYHLGQINYHRRLIENN